ncbi:MAG TPA: trigger factor [Candidatus Coprovivens excrementavium]|nr:trigger factor [Candidatus Coprovivens excrementavium]
MGFVGYNIESERKKWKMKNVHDIEIEIKGSEWEEILDSTFKKKNKDLKVDGFRKGKCPKSVYLQKFGIESLYMDAVDVACGKAYTNALRENNLIPVCEPKMDVKEIDKDHVKFTFTIITRPEVKLGKYKDLDVKKDEVKVSKKEIDEEVARLCSRFAEIVVKENGEVLEGNTAVIDFEGFVDGKPLEGGNGSNYPLEIGSHTFIPGFEEGLVGMKVDETKELDLKFPDEYTKELAGKDVKFKVTVREIKERVLPELNKDFYADLGYEDIETEEQFRKEVKKVIEERKKEEVKNKYLDDVLEAASKNMEVEINPEIIDDEVHRMINQFGEQLRMQGLSVDQYLQFTGLKHEDLHNQMEPEATKRVKYRYLIEEVANAEKIEISDEDANSEAEDMAANYDVSKEEFLTHFGGLEVVKYDMRMRKALEVLGGEDIK